MEWLKQWIGQDGIIVGVFLTVAGSIAAFAKFGLFSFGQKKGCPDPECSSKVATTAKNLDELTSDFKDFKKTIYKKTDNTNHLVAELDGFIRGKFN